MATFWTAPITAAREKVQDSLQTLVKEDLSKIEDFILNKIYEKPEGQSDPKKKRITITKKVLAQNAVLRSFYARKEAGLQTTAALASTYDFPEDFVSDGSTYSFGYIISVANVLLFDYSTKQISVSPAVSQYIRPFLLSFTSKKESMVKVIKGKVVDLNLIQTISAHGYPSVSAYIAVKTDPARFKSALASLKVSGDGINIVLANIYHKVMNGLPVPPLFSKKISFTNSIKSNPYMLPSGRTIFIPDVNTSYIADNIKGIKTDLAGSKKDGIAPASQLSKELIFFPDADTESLVCTDENGYLTSYSLSGIMPPDTKYKLHLLNKPITFFLDRNAGGLSSFIPLEYSTEVREKVQALYNTYGEDGTLIENVIRSKEALAVLESCLTYGASRYGRLKLSNWMAFMGIVHTMKALISESKNLVKEVAEKETKFKKCTPDNAPAIPNMKPGSVRFPHQAEALAKLDVAVDSAIIDVATGGGKANILIQDCINLLNKGLIRRPIVVMPNALVSQFLTEIANFTGSQVNGFALTSQVENNRGLDSLTKMAKNAPLNTIFVTTFSWLSKGGSFDDYDMDGGTVTSFESTTWLKQEIGIDYVAVDESQNIKNMGTAAFKAVRALGLGIRYKRISTGTLISNKPTDLIGQLMFLDPLLIGTKKDFDAKYAIKGDGKKGYKASMAEDIRARLRAGSSYIMYREKDWAPFLPKKIYSFSRVEQTPEQAKVYKTMVTDVMDEIKSDPKLAKAWQDMVDEGGSMDSVPAALLGKLAKLEMFLTAPDSSSLLKYANSDAVSPKVAEIDRLISRSLLMPGPNNKVIVAVHYKSSARHLLTHSKHKDICAYYDASKKDLIPNFQNPNSKIKVLFAVVQSIKEGLNLQIANRIIIADVDWTSGNLKQLEARIFRPHVDTKDGNVENLNKGKTIYIDTVIADDSADCVKYAFQSYKKILNSIIMEECPVDTPRAVPFSDEALSAKFMDPIIGGASLIDKIDQFNKWNQEEIDAAISKGDLKFSLVKDTKSNIGTEMIATPWVKGMVLPMADDEEPLLTYLEELGLNTDSEDDENADEDDTSSELDLTDYSEDLMDIRVRVEYGKGRIYGVRKASVLVRLKNGENVSVRPNVVLHKIGSVAKGLAKKDIRDMGRKISNKMPKKEALALVKKTFGNMAPSKPKQPKALNDAPDDSRNPRDIKDYFKSKGIKYVRQKSKVSKDTRCTLRHDGDELHVKTSFFKNLPLSEWKKYADMLLDGTAGTFEPDGSSPLPGAIPAISRGNKVTKGDKALSTQGIRTTITPLDGTKGLETPRVEKTKVSTEKSAAMDSLDAYLDDDFDFMTADEPTKAKKQVSKPEKSKTLDLDDDEDAAGIQLKVASYNNIPSLIVFGDGDEEEQLLDYKFDRVDSYWSYPVTNLTKAKAVLSKLLDNFDIPEESLNGLNKCLSEFKKGIYKTAFPEDGVKAFLLKNRKKVRKGVLRMYPLVAGKDLFFVVDVETHPGVTLAGYLFKKKKGYYIYTAQNSATLRTKFKEVVTDLPVTNSKQAKEEAIEHLKVRV